MQYGPSLAADPRVIDTPLHLAAWAEAAPAGAVIVYHRGLLMYDRGNFRQGLDKRILINKVGNIARDLSDQGLVHLFQRREGDGVCAYLAVRREG